MAKSKKTNTVDFTMKNIKAKSRIFIYLQSVIAITLLDFLMPGCATIFSGTQQELKVQPAGAQLEVYSWDGKLFASAKTESDMTVTVHRPLQVQSYLIRVQKEGYCPRYWLTSPKTNPLTYGSLIFGGPIGLYIDSSSGAGWSYEPTEFHLNIPETQQCGF